MLRKRSRIVGGSSSSSSSNSSKQGIMSEPLPLNPEKPKPKPRPNPHPSSPASTFQKHFSPRFDSAVSPTSILETKPNNPFFSSDPKTTPKPPKITPLLETASKGLVEALTGDDDDDDDDDDQTHNSPLNSSHERRRSRRRRRMVLFGSKLKIQIPSANPNPSPSPQSPIEFGFKNKESQLALLSPAQRALLGAAASAKLVVANLVVSDLELSEDYTCVISHGPNPKTTHIFDNCVIESRRRSSSSGGNGGGANESDLAGGGFLSSCHACDKRLEQGDEIFMYRGEKAFCSSDCRHREMLFDEAMD